MPGEFDLRFEEFVYRAEDHIAAGRPFSPSLVVFLSSREAAGRMASGAEQALETLSQPKSPNPDATDMEPFQTRGLVLIRVATEGAAAHPYT